MRIIAGSSRGRPLRAPGGRSTRPTSDRVREAAFDMLTARGCFEGEGEGGGPVVVDLFAGSGALGIEALSRGARRATFVESDEAAVRTVRGNLDAVGLGASARVVRSEVRRWVAGPGAAELAAADLLFADPPYAFDGWPALLAGVASAGFAGLAMLEAAAEVDPGAGWDVVTSRAYGSTVVQLVRPAVLAGLPLERKGGV